MNELQAPFPYFGGKSRVARVVWRALGRPRHYIEPFFGSGAVLLLRPAYDPTAHVETVCDRDGHVANVWRALQAEPEAVARVCDWPVNHADLVARKARLNERLPEMLPKLCADDQWYDVQQAGYWIWAASCWIGHGLISPNQRPQLSFSGTGVHKIGQIPHVSDGGRGVQEPYNANLYIWFRALSQRLRHVRVVCGDWPRVCGGNWQARVGPVGIFFDPPYGELADRDPRVYSTDDLRVATQVREWCVDRGERADHRIVLAGYFEEHESLLGRGWTVHRWSAGGGYASLGSARGRVNRHREALFFSPHCVREPLLWELDEGPPVEPGSAAAYDGGDDDERTSETSARPAAGEGGAAADRPRDPRPAGADPAAAT